MARRRPARKTGKKWNEESEDIIVENPRAWPEDTWETEPITKEEFLRRAMKSVIKLKD